MKYKVGDKVKVREDLIVNDVYGCCYFILSMDKCKGSILTIKSVFSNYYTVEENKWSWTDDMLEELSSEINTNTNIEEKYMKDFKIKNYKVYEDTALIVEFEDGTEEKAVANAEDIFDLERGVEIAVLKYIFGADKYKSMLKTAMKQIKAVDKAKEDAKKEEELIARKKAKAARRKARRLERKRKERIDEMKEAYLAAMKEYDTITLCEMMEDSFDYLK